MQMQYPQLFKILRALKRIWIFYLFEWYLAKPKLRCDPSLIKIGKDVALGESQLISAEVDIGDRVIFGPECMIIGGDHIFGRIGQFPRYIKPINRENCEKIIIEDDVWCGSRVIILKGVRIGKGAVIGAGSVVVKNIPPYCVAVGNPCKPVRKIFSDIELFQHLQLCGYCKEMIEQTINERNLFFESRPDKLP